MPKILITGGAGFIGSNLVDRYLNEGWEVLVYDNFSTGQKLFCDPRAQICEGDISNEISLRQAIESFSPDCISHHAAHVSVRNSFIEPSFDAEKNIIGSINVFRLAGECKVKQVVFASTGGVMLEKTHKEFPAPVQEGNLELDSPYALSKFCAEKYLRYFAKKYNYEYVILRYGNIYGPRQTPKAEAGVIALFLENMLKNKPITIYGDGNQTRDFLYVDDVVSGHFEATTQPISGTYNLSSAKEISVNQIYTKLSESLGFSATPEFSDFPFEEIPRSCLDNQKFKKATNWQPKYDFDTGLEKTITWNRDYHQSAG